MKIQHILAPRYRPQTVGKFERLNRTAKTRLGLVIYRSPGELEEAMAQFQRWYNEEPYHEAIGNLRPIDVYHGQGEDILARRRGVR